MKRRTARSLAALGTGYVLLHRLGRTWGSTPAERIEPLPVEDLVPRPTMVTNHAITIDVAPAYVWPWLVQMGWGRGSHPSVLRSRAVLAPRWIALTYWLATPADFVMARQMLRGIKRRAERASTDQGSTTRSSRCTTSCGEPFGRSEVRLPATARSWDAR